jgi:hypothetical protein
VFFLLTIEAIVINNGDSQVVAWNFVSVFPFSPLGA